jgi:hypothetical protein
MRFMAANNTPCPQKEKGVMLQKNKSAGASRSDQK